MIIGPESVTVRNNNFSPLWKELCSDCDSAIALLAGRASYINMWSTLAFGENKENSADPHDYCLANFVEQYAAGWANKPSGLKMINNMSILISIITKAIITVPFGSVHYHGYLQATSHSHTHPVLALWSYSRYVLESRFGCVCVWHWLCESAEAHVAGLALLPATQWGSATSCLAPTTHSCFIPKLASLSYTGQDKMYTSCNIIK